MISQAELIFVLNNNVIEIIAKVTEKTSVNEDKPSLNETTDINPKEAVLIPSKSLFIISDFINLLNIGFKISTSKNDGRKIPVVAAKAPPKPFI